MTFNLHFVFKSLYNFVRQYILLVRCLVLDGAGYVTVFSDSKRYQPPTTIQSTLDQTPFDVLTYRHKTTGTTIHIDCLKTVCVFYVMF